MRYFLDPPPAFAPSLLNSVEQINSRTPKNLATTRKGLKASSFFAFLKMAMMLPVLSLRHSAKRLHKRISSLTDQWICIRAPSRNPDNMDCQRKAT
eukprot:6473622-Amphidinium_carterae.1